MINLLIEELNSQSENLKKFSECVESINPIIKDIDDGEKITHLRNVITDLRPLLKDLEDNFNDLEELLISKEDKCINSEKAEESIKEEICDNNTLLISEIQNKVVLPYKVSDLKRVLKKNRKYVNLKGVIDKVYTVPMDKYKSAPTSRFKEAYILMRKREKASLVESLSVATEVSFNFALNPAIITACKNLDELDTYLDCLSDNELDKFDLFNIEYEILPQKNSIVV